MTRCVSSSAQASSWLGLREHVLLGPQPLPAGDLVCGPQPPGTVPGPVAAGNASSCVCAAASLVWSPLRASGCRLLSAAVAS